MSSPTASIKVNVSATLRNNCVLATLSGAYYHWLRMDSLASGELAKLKGVDPNAFQAFKNTFLGADRTLLGIKGVITKARNYHTESTIASCWQDYRVLPNVKIEEYRQVVLNFDLALDQQLSVLKTAWPQMLIDAEKALGSAFARDAYPTLESVLGSCWLRYSIIPIPSPEGFLISALDPMIADELRTSLSAEVTASNQNAVSQLGNQLMNLLENAKTNLSKNAETGGNFRIEWHKNLNEFLPKLKLFLADDNPGVLALAQRIDNFLASQEPESLRENLQERESAKSELESIIDTFGSMFGKEQA